jgi:hypothetical protein
MPAAQEAYRRKQREHHIYEGNHEAIIDEGLWQATQSAVSLRLFHKKRANDALSASMVFCGHCHGRAQWYRVRWKPQHGEPRWYAYYRCSPNNKNREGVVTEGCGWSVPAARIDEKLRSDLRSLSRVDEDGLRQMAAVLEEKRAAIVARQEARRRELQRALDVYQKRLSILTDTLLDQTITKKYFIQKRAEIEAQIAAARQQLTDFRPDDVPDHADVIRAMRKLPKARDDRQLRSLLVKLVRRIDVRSKSDIQVCFATE